MGELKYFQVDLPGPVACETCTGELILAVAEGPWGPIVSSRCPRCVRIRVPYEGPGAREAVFAARQGRGVPLNTSLRRRSEQRFRRRLRVRLGSSVAPQVGFTTDVSRHGLFVATNHLPASSRPILVVVVELPAGAGEVALRGQVMRFRDTPPLLASIARRGFGAVLHDPPPEWAAFVEAVAARDQAS